MTARRTTRPSLSTRTGRTSLLPGPDHWLFGIAVGAFAAVVYLPALRNGFIWDDPLVLEQLRAIRSVRDLLVPPAAIPHFYYRPIIFLSFLIDRALGGETPFWFHFSVVIAHAINTGLVWWLGSRLFGSTWAAVLGALIFAAHPIHVESVSWIAGRSDVIAGMFLILSAICLTYERRTWVVPAAVALYALGLFSKEVALSGLLLLPLTLSAAGRRQRWGLNAAILLVTLGYLVARRLALGAALTGMARSVSLVQILRDLVGAIGFYFSKLLLPINLSAYVPDVPPGWGLPALGLIGLGLCGIGAWACWRTNERVSGFLIAWFFLTLGPSLIVIIRHSAQAPVADRYLYLPSVAACLLLVRLLVWLAGQRPRWQAVVNTAVAGGALIFAISSVARNRVWADDLLFWQDVAARAPSHALGHRELAMIYMDRGQLEDAEASLRRALQEKSNRDGRVMTLNNLGTLYLRQRRLDEAEEAFHEAFKLYRHPYLYYGLGRLAMTRAEQAQGRGDFKEVKRQVLIARNRMRECLALDPRNVKAHVMLGQVLHALRDEAEARRHLQQALRLGARGKIAEVARQYLTYLEP